MQSRSNSNLKGIDISHYQGNVDFMKVKALGIEIVYMKATEGTTYTDPTLGINYKNGKEAGLKVGFYHFFRARNEANAKEQAKHFIDVTKGMDPDCRYALDLESAEKLDKNTLSSLAIVFMEEIKRLTGKEVVLYTYTSFARNNLTEALRNYPLWIAHYDVNIPGSNPIWDSWIGFQYTSSGSVNGISGRVDMNEFTPDILLNKPASQQVQQSNEKVRDLQHKLNILHIPNDEGKSLVEDGKYGPKTKSAVKKLQSITEIKVDGDVGPETWRVINQILSRPVTRKGDKGAVVRYVQWRVGATNDGSFGPATLNSVRAWQRVNGLDVDGSVGPQTWKALFN